MNTQTSTDDIRPDLDEKGLAAHGAAWGRRNHIVLRGTSKGPGIAVEVAHPYSGGPPRRVVSGDGSAHLLGGKLFITPRSALAGSEFTVITEF